jgi:flagellar hook-associated protein 2
MNSVSNLIQQSNPYSQFVDQLVMLESQKKFRLEDQKSQLSDKQSALSDVSSVISAFNSQVDELSSNTSNSFNPLKATSSNEEAISVDSISGLQDPNTYDISVSRKATKDITLSNVMDGTTTSLADNATQVNGAVDITIGDKTETINVSTENGDGTKKTNKEILESFSSAINNALGEESDSDVFSVDNDGNVQLSVKSSQTGYDERVQFANATGVLGDITGNMSHKVVDDGGTLNDLDAEFTVDGITFNRGQNTVDDAISGMTFTLNEATTEQEQITVTKDTDKARGNIDDFITKFNEMNSKIRQQTFINGETGNKGPLQDMRSIRNLTVNMRQIALTDMGSAGAGEFDNLSQIGIGFENDGTMKVEDSEKLNKALTERPNEVKNLFSNDDSPVKRMYQRSKTFTDSEGTISSLENGLDQKIDFLNNRIESEEKYLEQYEERQRQTFAEIHQMQQKGQRQYNQVMNQQTTL